MHTCTMNVPVLHLERFDSIKSAFMFLLLLPSSALLACTLRLGCTRPLVMLQLQKTSGCGCPAASAGGV